MLIEIVVNRDVNVAFNVTCGNVKKKDSKDGAQKDKPVAFYVLELKNEELCPDEEGNEDVYLET